jgi:glycosyltransferase involved in cell wall biosynthesis
LAKQLQSLSNQTLRPTELIVCDDNSGDETVSMLQMFRQQAPFPVHILVNERNLGSTRNFDQALELATGEFLALCDQDDLWFPEKLAVLSRVLEEDVTVGGVFSDALLIDDHGSPVQARRTLWELHGFNRHKQNRFVDSDPIDLLLQHDVVTGATLMVRASLRSVWHPIPVSWVHDGWITWMLAVESRLALVAEPLIGYRIHPQQQLGIGGGSRTERWKRMGKMERARYARVAEQFEDLLHRLRDLYPANAGLLWSLKRKIALLRERSQLPRNRLARIFRILPVLPAYWKCARGWRSLRKDLLLS